MINFKNLEKFINKSSRSKEERDELWKIVDEIVHHRIMECVLDNMDRSHHEEFLNKFSGDLENADLMNYLEDKAGKEITNKVKVSISEIEIEILNELN